MYPDDEIRVMTNDRGEPAVSYRWTGWVWEISSWCSRLQENYRSLQRNLWLIPQINIENRRMSTCNPLDLQTLGSQPIMPKNLPDHWEWPHMLWISPHKSLTNGITTTWHDFCECMICIRHGLVNLTYWVLTTITPMARPKTYVRTWNGSFQLGAKRILYCLYVALSSFRVF
jgi:hypothetical protein